MRYLTHVHKILELVIFAAAIIILEIFGTAVLHFQQWSCGKILLTVGHLRDIVLCDKYCLMLSSLFLSVICLYNLALQS
jgi:hypothetical protein